MQILSPIPDPLLPAAGRLWWRHFGNPLIRVRGFSAANGAVALRGRQVAGVIGWRDHQGGFLQGGSGLVALLYRPAPPTADLVIDGIAVACPREGLGRALIARAEAEARTRQRLGLRAEVAARNAAALAFYGDLGFQEQGRGRFGWPWTGQVLLLGKRV